MAWRGEESISDSVHFEKEGMQELLCATCGKPMDSPVQPRGDGNMYCVRCRRARVSRDETLSADVDFDLHHIERPYFDIESTGLQ